MNFGQMVTYVSKRLIDPDNTAVSADDVKQGINDSIAYWKFRRFWFNEVKDEITQPYHDPIIPVVGDGILVPSTQYDGFYIEYGRVRYPLVKISQQEYDNLYLENGYGMPLWYSRIGSGENADPSVDDQYVLYPIPDRDYTLGRHYLKDYNDLSNDSDTNDFTVNAARLINLWALYNLAGELRQDTAAADMYNNRTQDEYRQLRVLTNKKNASGHVTIYSALNVIGGGV